MGWTFYNSNGQRLSSAATNISVLDIDGATDIGANIVDADLFIIDDGAGGTNRKTAASRIKTYVGTASGIAKAWAQIEQAGPHSSPLDYGCDTFTDGGLAGQTDIVFDTNFSSSNYSIVGMCGETSVMMTDFGSHAVDGITIANTDMAGTRQDNNCYVAVFGNQ